MSKTPGQLWPIISVLLHKIPIVCTIMDYMAAVDSNTMTVYLLAQQVQQHQKIMEKFLSISQALSSSFVCTDAVSSEHDDRRPN